MKREYWYILGGLAAVYALWPQINAFLQRAPSSTDGSLTLNPGTSAFQARTPIYEEPVRLR